MTVDLARRGMLKALGLASSMVVGPGKALAQAAVAAAASTSAAEVTWLAHGVEPCAPYDPDSQLNPIARYALELLRNEEWAPAEERHGIVREIRPEIVCFRSASTVAKLRWEREERSRDRERLKTVQKAVEMIRSGKIPL